MTSAIRATAWARVGCGVGLVRLRVRALLLRVLA